MILDQLKSGTATAHASLERRLSLAQANPTLESYSSYLAAMLGFVSPLEAQFGRLPPAFQEELELGRRCKAELLAKDLSALAPRIKGGAPSSSTCAALPGMTSVAQALGILYVLEGSTLGARWLLRHLQPLGIESCSDYLFAYGDDLGPMWQKLRASLLRHTEKHPEQSAQVVSSALETFQRLDEWFVRCGAAEVSQAA